MFRKPTQYNFTINNRSVHPLPHKTSSFRGMLYRAYYIHFNVADRNKKINKIKSISKANGY